MKKFSEYTGKIYESSIETPEKKAVFCWGRFNPPTRGHEKVFDHAYKVAEEEKASFYIFTSQTSDDDKNPLDYFKKIKTLEKYFPKYFVNIVRNTEVKTLFDTVNSLIENKFDRAYLVVGEDRVQVFQKQMRDYFSDKLIVRVITAGDRTDGNDVEDVESISGQMLRDFVRKGDLESFIKGSPKSAKRSAIEDTFHDIRRRYGLPNQKKSQPVEIETTPVREMFFQGHFTGGDKILKTTTNQIGEIKSLGSNFLNVLFLGEEKTRRVWPSEVIKL